MLRAPDLQINTRYWGFKNETNGSDPTKAILTLVPLIDMTDHTEVHLKNFFLMLLKEKVEFV